MAIGGSITLTTQAVAKNTPSISTPLIQPGIAIASAQTCREGYTLSNRRYESHLEGMLAPEMVIQNTRVKRSNMIGKPQIRLVTSRSIVASRSSRSASPSRVTARSAMRAASV